MGFKDPYHKHPLRTYHFAEVNKCFHCRLPIDFSECYLCRPCNFYIHRLCGRMPETMRHPLHLQHPLTLLTLFASNPITNFCCNKCHLPLLEGYSYHCSTCQFYLHLRCFVSLDHEKHEHPLLLRETCLSNNHCSICSYPVKSFNFSCNRCNFYIHHDCSIIPPKIKHYHVHELTLRHNFPEECEQYYCDRCEDRDGELDRNSGLAFYYCKDCDYIAHMLCIITQPKEDAIMIKSFTHEHPLRLTMEDLLCCNLCHYSVKRKETEYPSLLKHPRHPEHALTLLKDNKSYKCTDCEITSDKFESIEFFHPYGKLRVEFLTDKYPFVCDLCGELGKGSRMTKYGIIDFHLECFALPGKLEQHKSHPQDTLYLSSYRVPSTRPNCSVCYKEIDKSVWVYCCLDCSTYVAHVTCVANDLLSTLRSSIKNQPGFCAIIEPDKKSFQLHTAQIGECKDWPPKSLLAVGDKTKTFKVYVADEVDGKVRCPNCNIQICLRTKDSARIADQESSHSRPL